MNYQAQIIIILCIAALIAIIINKFRKLPKFIFVFFATLIVVSVCWFTFEKEFPSTGISTDNKKSAPNLVFVESANGVLFSHGETKIKLPILISGDRKFDCIRFVINAEKLKTTEQSFLDKVKFSLILEDGTLLPAYSISFEKYGETSVFPENFILKVFFIPKNNVKYDEVMCVVENNFFEEFIANEISVGSLTND